MLPPDYSYCTPLWHSHRPDCGSQADHHLSQLSLNNILEQLLTPQQMNPLKEAILWPRCYKSKSYFFPCHPNSKICFNSAVV